MPIYEYVCKNCEKGFEVLVRSSSQEIHCPGCQGKEVEKQFSTFGMKSGDKFVSSSGSGCGSCSSHNCQSCNCH